MSDAVREFITMKEKAGCRAAYIKSLRQYLAQFANGRNHRPVEEFTPDDIELWFAARNEAPSTRASNLGRLSSFFSFCKRRRWIHENPCDYVERLRIDRATPAILKPEQLELLFTTSIQKCPQFVLWLTLGSIVGMRPTEILHETRKEVSETLSQHIIIVSAHSTKTRTRRVIHLNAQAQAWVQLGLDLGGRETIGKMTMRRRVRQMREWLGLKEWPQDLLRHTALSYQLAETQDAARVALSAGNSPKILLTHYNGLVNPVQLAKFKMILP